MTAASNGIPVILTGHALRSLRDSGYSLAAALGEVIDNSLEADANSIQVRLEDGEGRTGKKRIHRIVVVDDGRGMDVDTLHHYLQIGYSTRYMRTDTIGKYGVGAKLAALNYARQIEVWSRTSGDQPWRHVCFDLDAALDQEESGQSVSIDPPRVQPPPEELEPLLPKGAGTLVIWSKVDRLEEGRRAPDGNALRVEVEKELSRMFRYFLNGGISISVNGKELLAHDPLFIMQGTWADSVLTEHYSRRQGSEGQARDAGRPSIPNHFAAELIAKESIQVGQSTATLTVTLYPPEVARERYKGGDELARKLRVPENEGSLSFVRLNREINYTNVPRIFPRGVEPADRFIGIEVSFTPELDEYFGVRNVKRGVEPHDELRIRIRKLLRKYVLEARRKLDELWGDATRKTRKHKGEHAPILGAAKDANRTLPKARAKGPGAEEDRQRILDDLARDVVGDDEAAKEEYLESINDLPFVVESIDYPGYTFIDIQHLSDKVIIRLNARHRFYRELWEPIRSIAEQTPGTLSSDEAVRAARRTVEALTLLIIAYGKAESMDEYPHEHYGDLRGYWGQFLDSLLGKVKDIL